MNLLELFVKIGIDSDDVESGIEKIKSGLSTFAKTAAVAAGAATTAVTAFAKASVDAGMQFDSSMSQAAATMGTTVDNIQELRDFAIEMGARTAFSATQAADALNYMALAGYDAEQSMQALPNVLNLAAAGGIDLAAASDMVTDAQSALGLSMEESAGLVDKMAMASSKSNTSVAQLGDAILTVGGTAQNLAGGTTELAAALGILADNGIKGAEGGTHLRNVILSLSAPTDTAASALNELGVEVFDASGNMRPLNETLGGLQDAMSSMTSAEQTQLISTIFNKTDIAAVNALLSNTGERWSELAGYIDNAAGAAEKMANTQLDNLAGDITLFQSALEGAQIVLSDQLTPGLREFVQFGTNGITMISGAFKENGLSGAMEAFGAVLSDGLNAVMEELPAMVDAGMQLLGAFGQGLIDNLPSITDTAVEIVTMLANGIIDGLPDIVKAGAGMVKGLADGISNALRELIPVAVDAILELCDTLTSPDTLSGALDAALEIILALADGLIDALPSLLEKAPTVIENLTAALVDNAPKLAEAAITLIASLVIGIATNLPRLAEAALAIVGAIIEGIANLAGMLLEAGATVISGIWDGIKRAFSGLVEQIGELLATLVETIINFFAGLPERLAYVLGLAAGTIISWVQDAITFVVEEVPEIIENILSFFVELPGKLADLLGEAVAALSDFVAGMVTTVVEGIPEVIESIVSFFLELPDKIFEIGKDILNGLWDGIVEGWDSFVQGIQDLIDGFVQGIKDALGIHSPSKVFAGIGENMALGLGAGWDDEFSDVKRSIADSMDLGTATAGFNVTGGVPAPGGYGAQSTEQSIRDIVINLTADLDGTVLARKMAVFNAAEVKRSGGDLVPA